MSPNQFPGQTLAPVPASALLGSDDDFSSLQKIDQLLFNIVQGGAVDRPPAPTMDSLAPDFATPTTALDFTFTPVGSWDSFTYELYSDAGLTHLVVALTQPGPFVNETISGLTPGTTYWIRGKITLDGVDSLWSNTLSGSTDP